jgi:DDE_Tnp_1-associated
MDATIFGESLLKAFEQVPDPRSSHGIRHPLPAILALACAAMLSGARSVYAIGQWGRLQKPEVVRALGFKRDQTPAVSTIHEVFKALEVTAFEAVLREWAQSNLGEGTEAIAIDGKGLRGIHGEEMPGVRLVAAYADGAGLVLAQSGGKQRPSPRGAERS